MHQQTLHLQPWNPKTHITARQLISNIHAIAPELEVLFMGAAALGIPGKNDLDLDILCDKTDIATYVKKLLPVLGQPKETKPDLTAWEFVQDGFEVDIIISDPKISHVPLQQKRFQILKQNPALLREYVELKKECDGQPYDEYEKRKKEFFTQRVLSAV